MKKRNAILLLCLCLAFFLPGCSEDDFTDKETGQFSSFSDITDQESVDSDITGESDEQDAFAAIDENGYCYSQLSSDEQIVYGQVLSAVLNRTEVSVATLSDDLLDKVFNCVLYDHPELFYIDGYQYTTRTRDDEIVAISFHANVPMGNRMHGIWSRQTVHGIIWIRPGATRTLKTAGIRMPIRSIMIILWWILLH